MNEYYVDFEGFAKIKALDIENAKEILCDIIYDCLSEHTDNLGIDVTDVEED